MFSNCVLYNGAESEIGLISQNLQREFDRLSAENNLESYLHEEGRSEMRDESRTEDQRDEDMRHEFESHGVPAGKKYNLLLILISLKRKRTPW